MEEMPLTLFTTLQEAKDWVIANRIEGCICPTCGQIAKIYKRKLNNSMALGLIKLNKLCRESTDAIYFHVNSFTSNGGGDFAKLIYWDLVKEKEKDEEETFKRTSGYWTITEKGRLFVQSELEVQSHIFLYDSKLLGFSDKKTNIMDSLGKKVNYLELMNS